VDRSLTGHVVEVEPARGRGGRLIVRSSGADLKPAKLYRYTFQVNERTRFLTAEGKALDGGLRSARLRRAEVRVEFVDRPPAGKKDKKDLHVARAVQLLADRPADANALDALRRAARNDRFWGVRARAVDALGAWGADSSRATAGPMRAVTDALIVATRDTDSRVRHNAALALGSLAISGVGARDVAIRLRQLARDDASYIVRGAALAADIRMEKNAALPLAKQLMAADLWQDVIRTPALNALKAIGTAEALQLAQQFPPSSQ